jgi:LysM repeat protein
MKRRIIIVVTLVCLLLSGIASVFVSTVGAEDGVYHTVLWGETLSGIARRYGVAIADIVAANSLANANLIYAGQKLLIPIEMGDYVEHVVVAGETLSAIAAKYGVTYWDIAIRNGIANPNLIYVGQKLIVPVTAAEEETPTEETPAEGTTPAEEPATEPAAAEAIVITSPAADAEISSPVTVTGFGAGFENTLAVDILDQTGVAIGQGYVIVDAEFGQTGPFTGTIEFTAPAEAQLGRIQVYTISPRDGAIEHLASVTVNLKP